MKFKQIFEVINESGIFLSMCEATVTTITGNKVVKYFETE